VKQKKPVFSRSSEKKRKQPRAEQHMRSDVRKPHEAMATADASAPVSARPSVLQRLRSRFLLDEELPENEYYLAVATRYRLAKYAVILLTVLLLLGMMAVFSEDITVENLRYLLRDLDSGDAKVGVYETIRYDSGSDLRFALYKGDLVVVRPGQSTIYGTDGRTVQSTVNGFYNPILLSSDRYFMIYDPGQTSYSLSLHSAFSTLHTLHTESPIYDGALSDEGSFAVVTEAVGYRGVVSIYGADFEPVSTVYKDKYVWDVAMSSDAEHLLVLSAADLNGEWSSEVHLLSGHGSQTERQWTIEGALAFAGHLLPGDGICLITDRDIRFSYPGQAQEQTVSFGGQVPLCWAFGDTYQAVAFNKNILGREKLVKVYSRGKEMGSFSVEGQITSMLWHGNQLFVLTEEQVLLYEVEKQGEMHGYTLSEGCQAILCPDDTHLMLCYGDRTETIELDELILIEAKPEEPTIPPVTLPPVTDPLPETDPVTDSATETDPDGESAAVTTQAQTTPPEPTGE